jgi:hypothetical protein
MKRGPQMSGRSNSGLQMPTTHSSEASRTSHGESQMQVSPDHPPATARWVATFAHISPTGVVTTGAYYSDPSNTVITRFLFPLVDCPAVSEESEKGVFV